MMPIISGTREDIRNNRINRKLRWRKVFKEKPEYASKIISEMNPLTQLLCYFHEGKTAVAYHSAKEFINYKGNWKGFKSKPSEFFGLEKSL